MISVGCRERGRQKPSKTLRFLTCLSADGSSQQLRALGQTELHFSVHTRSCNEHKSTWMTFVLQPAEAAHAGAEAAASEAAAGAEASKTEADSGSVRTSRDSSPFPPSHPFVIQQMWEAGLGKLMCGCHPSSYNALIQRPDLAVAFYLCNA